MPQIINTNISSLTAQRNLNKSQVEQATALQRLSSGLRINSAKDDAAGLAISTRFSSQTRGLGVAIRNAGDGISLSQTAEGALGSITDSLQRVRELALQAANGTNSDTDRQALNAEAQQLISEITRTGEQTNFNGRKLLDGSFTSQFQIGANAGETIDISVNKLTSDSLGVASTAGVSAVGSDNALGNGDLIINGTAVGPSKAGSDTSSTSNAAASSISKAAAINAISDETGVTAIVDENVSAGSAMTAGQASGLVTLNGVDISVDTTTDTASTRSAVASAINAVSNQTGITAIDTGEDNLGVQLVAADGRNIELNFSGALTSANTGLGEGGAATDALVHAPNASSNTALDFSGSAALVTTASQTFNGNVATETDIDFSTTALSFSLTTESGTFDVVLNHDYSNADDGLGALGTDLDLDDLAAEITEQLTGSGITATFSGVALDTARALTFTTTPGTDFTFADGAETGATGVGASLLLGYGGTETSAGGTVDAVSFDVAVTDRAGSTSSYTVDLNTSVADLDGLVSAINTSLSSQTGTVEAINDNGTLAFQTTSGVEGGLAIGNFRTDEGGSATSLAAADINALFGFDLTTSTTSVGVGSGVQGTASALGADADVTLNAAAVGTAGVVRGQTVAAGTAYDLSAANDGMDVTIYLGDETATLTID